MARVNIDEYMDTLQLTALRLIDHKKLRNDDIMFRVVDAEPLVPRFRVEIGIVVNGYPLVGSTMREKDPKVVGKRLAEWVMNTVAAAYANEMPN